MMRHLLIASLAIVFVGCAGKVAYIRPTTLVPSSSNTTTLERGRDAVWSASVPELGKRFFVINNLDKASGLMNISYTGDPERYIDCGRISSYVKNARGERTHEFSGAKAQQSYEVMNPGGLFIIDRRMSLEGRVNLIFEEIGSTKTRVTANTRYVVVRTSIVRNMVNNIPQNYSDTNSFNTGSSASFPANSEGLAAECLSTGLLEQEILSAIK